MRKIIKILSSKLEIKNIIRRNFLINCIILTLISVILAIGSSKYLFKYELPDDNFITLETSVFLEVDCLELSDTGLPSELNDCVDGRYEVYRTRASGAVLSTVDNISYILTADHFCDVKSNLLGFPSEIIPDLSIERIIKKDGRDYKFEIASQNPDKDLCLITSEEYLVDEHLEISRKMPEVGELTSTISSPLGISESGVSLHFSGTFSGCNFSACFFTIPAISGSSGSLVLDYDKKIVGMTQRSLVGFPEVTIGVGSKDILEFIQSYENESGRDITPKKFSERFSF